MSSAGLAKSAAAAGAPGAAAETHAAAEQATPLSFRELIAPLDPAAFLADTYGRTPLHVPAAGSALDKPGRSVTWEQINQLLEMTSLWSDSSLELALGGRTLAPQAYCYEGIDREGRRSLRPDTARVQELIARGATVVLNYIDTLLPGVRATSAALASAVGAPVSVSLFASWHKVQGYNVHFDTQNVFALQVVGRKTWQVFANREENPARIPGFDSQSVSPEEAAKRKGPLLLEVTLEPGDLLYLPPGFYHQALAETDASVHIGYGACHFLVQDFVNLLVRDLPKISGFRAPLAHFDEPEALARQLGQVADQLREIVRQPQQAETMRQFLKAKAFEQFAVYDLPQRRPNQRFRLRRAALAAGEPEAAAGEAAAGEPAAALERWARQVELFALSDLEAAFAGHRPAELETALKALIQRGLIEPV